MGKNSGIPRSRGRIEVMTPAQAAMVLVALGLFVVAFWAGVVLLVRSGG